MQPVTDALLLHGLCFHCGKRKEIQKILDIMKNEFIESTGLLSFVVIMFFPYSLPQYRFALLLLLNYTVKMKINNSGLKGNSSKQARSSRCKDNKTFQMKYIEKVCSIKHSCKNFRFSFSFLS